MRNSRNQKKNPFTKMVLVAMLLSIGILVYKIEEKVNIIKPFLYNSYQTLGSWIPYEKWFPYFDQSVSTTIQYQLLSDNFYVNGSNSAGCISDGIVLAIADNRVTVLQDNGIISVYGHLDSVLVKVDERILKGATLGTFEEFLSIDFMKDNQAIDYQSAMA